MSSEAAVDGITPSQDTRHIIRWIVWAHVLMVGVGIVLVYLSAHRDRAVRSEILPIYSQVPDFSLVDSDGSPFGRSDLEGQVWIADFVYTTCPGPCPSVTAKLAGFQEPVTKLPDARLVTITVNPEVDTPAQLRDYAKSFDAADRWVFLTGAEDQIHDLVQNGFKLSVARQEGEDPVLHSTKLVLVDQAGFIRGYYDAMRPDEMRKLGDDLARLAR